MSLLPSDNAAKQAQARSDTAGIAAEDQSLDPDFPYVVIKFDPTVFGAVAEQTSN